MTIKDDLLFIIDKRIHNRSKKLINILLIILFRNIMMLVFGLIVVLSNLIFKNLKFKIIKNIHSNRPKNNKSLKKMPS